MTVRSAAAGAIAHALVSTHPALRVTIAALPSRLAWYREDLAGGSLDPARLDRISFVERALFEPTAPSDAVLLVRELEPLEPSDAALALRRAAASLRAGGRILVEEELLDPDDADEHPAEADVLRYTLHGTGLRTDAELRAIVADAGLEVEAADVFGWGITLYRLAPR